VKKFLLVLILLILVSGVFAHTGESHPERNVVFQLDDLDEPAFVPVAAVFGIFGLLFAFSRQGFLLDNFESLMVGGMLWFISGGMLDLFNHHQGAPIDFFTIEHGIAYSGAFFLAGLVSTALIRGWREGDKWKHIPSGYLASVVGPFIILLGGLADMFWHRAFGFEVKTASQGLSPSHLVIFIGAMIFSAGPLLNAYIKGVSDSWKDQWKMLTSASLIATGMLFMANHFHPFINIFSADYYEVPEAAIFLGETLGIIGIVFHTAVMVSIFLFLARRFELVKGSFTLISGLTGLFLSIVNPHLVFIPLSLLSGLIADILYLKVGRMNRRGLRIFSAVFPFTFCLMYFATVEIFYKLTWVVHIWTGVAVLSGIFGLLISFLAVPPEINKESDGSSEA
jgi:hypothetical protein